MLNSQLAEWLNLIGRWVHLIAGIAWIGSSFYFMWLDSALEAPETPDEKIEGQLWMVHSGGFYQVQRRRIGPGQMPKTLHWFKWEAMITWLSGLFLLAVVYYLSGGAYLLDSSVSAITNAQAVGMSIGLLVAAWFVYDTLFQSALGRSRAATVIAAGLLVGLVYGLTHVLSGRAAYIHVGAILGSCMTLNVWVRILPAQQKMVDATARGEKPDFTNSDKAKRRSVHNTYITFPLLFIMLSNHFPSTFGNRLNWVVLLLIMVAGAGVRHLMVAKNTKQAAWVLWPVGAALVALIYLTAPISAPAAAGPAVPFSAVHAIVGQRCLQCHSANPT
ncbi:MAG: urate hydroxylase PuuD, partial [Deltaproteobacteria bacterium]|nr:urate hydroxylase PuuD [Deltaproteobacteria bacterium]